jgi:hypothetical protein
MSEKPKFPSEVIELPSKGLIYPKENPLSSGKVEMKYMTAREEDILTNQNFIKQGIVIDKLLQSLIVSKINYDDLVTGDKNALLVAARILGYGSDYSFDYDGEKVTIDLSKIEPKELDEKNLLAPNTNRFKFTLPFSKFEITFKLLTQSDEKLIENELKGLKKAFKNTNPELTTRFKHMILSINGDDDHSSIREFVDNNFLARDSKAFREYIKKVQPDVDLTFDFEGNNGLEEGVSIPITTDFFWPDI